MNENQLCKLLKEERQLNATKVKGLEQEIKRLKDKLEGAERRADRSRSMVVAARNKEPFSL